MRPKKKGFDEILASSGSQGDRKDLVARPPQKV